MNLRGGTFLALATIAACTSLTRTVNVYEHQDRTYRTYAGQVYEKADAILGYTQLTVHLDGSIRIARHGLFSSTLYKDSDNDGDVDVIQKIYGPERNKTERIFFREQHKKLFPEMFQEADKDFQEQEKRFGFNPATQ